MINKVRFVFKFYLQHFKKYKFFFLIPILFSIFMAFYESFAPYMIKVIIDRINNAKESERFWQAILFPALWYIVLTELVNIAFRTRDWFKLKILPELKSSMIAEIYDYLLKQSYRYFQNNQVGSVSNKISDLIKGTETIIGMISDVILWRLLSIFIAAILIFTVSIPLAIFTTIWGALFVLITIKLSSKSHDKSIKFAKSRNILFGFITDSFTNILDVILFQSKNQEKSRLKELLNNHKKTELNMLWNIFKIATIQGISVTLFTAFIIIILLYAFNKQLISVGDIAFIMMVSGTIIRNIYSISSDLVQFSRELGNCWQAIQIINQPIEIIDLPNAKSIEIKQGNLTFKNVSFEYNKGQPIFHNKNLIIPGGQKVGLVGYSGGGKSTLISLILRLFDVTKGSILIDGQNIKNINQESLRASISVIPQNPSLFHRSIMDNIRDGKHNATKEEVIEAAKKAYIHDFINNLTEGYDSMVGERGIKISGGQRQRIAIARAILKNAPILILDEATSQLDSLTERYIQESLTEIMSDKTTIVIAHRLSTLFNMDRILVFNNGKIVEDGTHDYLISKNGLYKRLWDEQIGGFLPSKDLSSLAII